MKNILFMVLFIPMGLFAQKPESYYFVFLNTNPDKEVLDSIRVNDLQTKHLANINRLYNEGKIVAAGPFSDGGGLFIFRDNSLENVKQLLQTDPAIRAKRFKLEVYPFRFLRGKTCSFSRPMEMVTYTFLRIPKGQEHQTIKRLSNLAKSYDKDLLVYGVFEKEQGGFMVVEKSEAKPVNQRHAKKGRITSPIQIRQLYIAKGTFCATPKK